MTGELQRFYDVRFSPFHEIADNLPDMIRVELAKLHANVAVPVAQTHCP